MASLRDALTAFLNADATLTALLTGGVLDASDLPQGDMGIKDVPHSGAKILPFAVIRWRGTTGTEIVGRTERRSLEIYFYQHRGYDVIEPAKRRVKKILSRTKIPADDAKLCMFHWAKIDLGDFSARELGGASADMSRYYVDVSRKA